MFKKATIAVLLIAIISSVLSLGLTVQAKTEIQTRTVVGYEYDDGKGPWMYGTEESGGVCNFNVPVDDGALRCLYNSHDGYWVRTSDLNIETSSFNKITIRMKQVPEGEGADMTQIAMFFTTQEDPDWTETKCIRVDVEPLSVTGEYREYTFDMTAKGTWAGTLKQLCFQACPCQTRDKQNWLYIDYIRLQIDEEVEVTPETGDIMSVATIVAVCAVCTASIVIAKKTRKETN